MKFKNAIQNIKEEKIPVTGNTTQGKKLLNYRGIKVIILDEGKPEDVMGIPQDLEAYGRGWADQKGQIQVDGGPQGSRQGHPTWAVNGFYWGADYQKQCLYIRGRASTDPNWLATSQNLLAIIDLIFPRLPRP